MRSSSPVFFPAPCLKVSDEDLHREKLGFEYAKGLETDGLEDCQRAARIMARDVTAHGGLQQPSMSIRSDGSPPPPPLLQSARRRPLTLEIPEDGPGGGASSAGDEGNGAAGVDLAGVGDAAGSNSAAPTMCEGGPAGVGPRNLGGHRVRHAKTLTVESLQPVTPRTEQEVRCWAACLAKSQLEGGSDKTVRDRAVKYYNTNYFALAFSGDVSAQTGLRGHTSSQKVEKRSRALAQNRIAALVASRSPAQPGPSPVPPRGAPALPPPSGAPALLAPSGNPAHPPPGGNSALPPLGGNPVQPPVQPPITKRRRLYKGKDAAKVASGDPLRLEDIDNLSDNLALCYLKAMRLPTSGKRPAKHCRLRDYFVSNGLAVWRQTVVSGGAVAGPGTGPGAVAPPAQVGAWMGAVPAAAVAGPVPALGGGVVPAMGGAGAAVAPPTQVGAWIGAAPAAVMAGPVPSLGGGAGGGAGAAVAPPTQVGAWVGTGAAGAPAAVVAQPVPARGDGAGGGVVPAMGGSVAAAIVAAQAAQAAGGIGDPVAAPRWP